MPLKTPCGRPTRPSSFTPLSPQLSNRTATSRRLAVVGLTVFGLGASAIPASASPAAAAPLPAVAVPTLAPRTADTAGSLPVGSASYPLPTGAVYVSPTGLDTNTGTVAAPLRTLAKALLNAPSGGTIVLRGGDYREKVAAYKPVTIQNYPGEAVWLDGAPQVTGWVKDGALWRKDGWTTRFDHSPTYTKGAPDGAPPYWQFVNPTTPMAAYPDAVWIDGYQKWQAKTKAEVGPGYFYLDEATSQLYIGDDPTGKQVNASTLTQAMNIRASDVTLRGIGIRRYATSVWMVGAITLEKPRIRLENVHVSDNATTGVSIQSSDAVLKSVTVEWSGMLGIQARFADRVTFSNVAVRYNNAQRFNITPVAGGIKIVKSRGIVLENSDISRNYGHGFWEDMSDYDTIIRGSNFNDNAGDGAFLEISAKAIVGNNTFLRNGMDGLIVNNTSNVKVWNNTFAGNARPMNIVQDSRRNTVKSDPAVDERQAWPDPNMPWTLGPVAISNNVVGPPRPSVNCLICVEDYSFSMSAEKMGITYNGNIYNRLTASQPTWLAVWSSGSTNPFVLNTLAAFKTKTSQEATGREYTGSRVVAEDGTLSSTVASIESTIAQPLPADVAAAIGQPTGTRHLGVW